MFSFKITPDGAPDAGFEVDAGMRDLRRWEKTHKGKVFGQIANAASMSAVALYEIAFAACSRQGLVPASLTEEQFADSYDLDLVQDEDEDEDEEGEGPEDPTPAAA